MKRIGSFVSIFGWGSLFLGQIVLGLSILAVGFSLIILGKE